MPSSLGVGLFRKLGGRYVDVNYIILYALHVHYMFSLECNTWTPQ